MPTLWSVRDGPRASSTRGEGTPSSFEEIRGAFGKYPPRFLSESPPTFNVQAPSNSPSHIVVEVKDDDVVSIEYPKPGFYELERLSPAAAERLLHKYRQEKRDG